MSPTLVPGLSVEGNPCFQSHKPLLFCNPISNCLGSPVRQREGQEKQGSTQGCSRALMAELGAEPTSPQPAPAEGWGGMAPWGLGLNGAWIRV